jgi:hypothetical protein
MGQPLLGRPVVEDMANVALPMAWTDLVPDHAETPIRLFRDVGRLQGTVKLGHPPSRKE